MSSAYRDGHGPEEGHETVDVVVVGSGAAGLTAATTASDAGARVLVVERAEQLGGTTAVSGGMPWVPMNAHMRDVGVVDSREEALTYLRRLTMGREPAAELLEVYVDTAADAIAYLEAKTPLRLSAPPTFSDYHADLPGGKPAGRSLEPAPFDAAARLGTHAARVRTGPHLPWLTFEEGAKFGTPDGPHVELAARRQKDDVRVVGASLIASLYRGLMDRGVEVRTSTRVRGLVASDNGDPAGPAVAGVVVDGPGTILARKGVVLACGGYEWNEGMVRAFIGHDLTPLTPPHNEGDGHLMGMAVGARLANMGSYWGQPAFAEPGFAIDGREVSQMAMLRGVPGVLMVNRRGRRFTNEGIPYNDLPKIVDQYDPVAMEYPNESKWVVFDHEIRESVPIVPGVQIDGPLPGWVAQAATVRELAVRIGVDPDELDATVRRWNSQVESGDDPDFGRGTLWWEGFMVGGPTAAMRRSVGVGPFYAVPLVDGTLGTNGGLVIDADARVRRWGGGVVPGLYAAGNVTASVFGPAYPGGGATIGPAITFGFLAGRHAGARVAGEGSA